MELTVLERLTLRGILPEKGDFVTFKAVTSLHETLSFDQDEIDRLGLEQSDGQITWNATADTPREFSFTKIQLKVITDLLERIEANGELDARTFPLYEKFIEQE